MPFLNIDAAASNALSTGLSSPFLNNAYLVVGGGSAGAGIEGTTTDSSPTATANAVKDGTSGPITSGYGATPSNTTPGALGSLLGSTTFWVAVSALATLWFFLGRKKSG